jgi:NACHT domain- and WD repeat-containing protein
VFCSFRLYARVLKGFSDKLPNLHDCVRVFTSSTFTDTGSERNFLIDRVYPALMDVCRQHGITFHAVDLRWGIRDEATDDHRTAEICMTEIDKCAAQSLGPVFVHFSTNKVQ